MTDDECVLVGNTFANVMQVVAALTAALILILHKILIEDKKLYMWLSSAYIKCNGYTDLDFAYKSFDKSQSRSWELWFKDNIKQGLSTTGGHVWGTAAAIILSKYSEETDECAWFFLQFIVDTTIGVGLSILLSKYSIQLVECYSVQFSKKWLSIGNYETYYGADKTKIWTVQTIHWFICSIIARMLCTILLIFGHSSGITFSTWFSNEWSNRHAELIFAILIIPMILDTVQLLIQNWYLHWVTPLLDLEESISSINVNGNAKLGDVVSL